MTKSLYELTETVEEALADLHHFAAELTRENAQLKTAAPSMPAHFKPGTEVWVVDKTSRTLQYGKVLSVDIQVLSDSVWVFYNVGGVKMRAGTANVFDNVMQATKHLKG